MYGATISFGQLLLYYINILLYNKRLKFCCNSVFIILSFMLLLGF